MPRIKIKDLPKDLKISREEMRRTSGGIKTANLIAASYLFDVFIDEDGKARVRFGDGETGARLPTGRNNIAASYRR